MPRFLALALAGLVMSSGLSPAVAQERPWYVTIDAGLSATGHPDFSDGRLTTRQGSALGGSIGRYLGQSWRLEAAVMYRNNAVRQVSASGFDARPGDADWASVVLTVNGFHDFDAFRLGQASVRPYVGLGAGHAQEVDADLSAAGAEREFSGSSSAGQLMAGLRWDYGSSWVADVGVALTQSRRIRLVPTGSGATVEARYRATTVMARLGYRF